MVSWSPSLPNRDQNYPDYRFRLRIRIYNQVHDRLKIDQDWLYSYADNFSRDKFKNNNFTYVMTLIYNKTTV